MKAKQGRGDAAVNFEQVLDQAIGMLYCRGRLTYRTLKRQFDLADEVFEDLKEELIYGQRVAVDEDERVLVWNDEAPTPTQNPQAETDSESRLQIMCLVVIQLLQRERRITYRALKYRLGSVTVP